MIKVVIISFLLIAPLFCFGQTTLSGKINDSYAKPIPYANILVKKDSLSIIAYTYSDENGFYSLDVDILENQNLFLVYTSLGFKAKKIKLKDLKSSANIDVVLQDKSVTLDEVIITTDVPIRVKKDTITFNVDKFASGNEIVIEDLLKKIPGLTVDNNGTIRVGNTEIEKLMVEGDDFFEKGYKLLSKNMPAHPIKKVEVLKNYSNNHLLKDVEISDKIALNLTLKEDAKRVWFGSIDGSYGMISENRYHLRSNIMNFGKKNKYFAFTNFNNVGFDPIGDINHLIRPPRSDRPSNVGDNQHVNNLLNLSIVNQKFKESRTNFNNAELLSLNAIFNPTERLKIKTLGFFNWDETDFFRNSTDRVNVTDASFINSEEYKLLNKNKIAFGKLDIIYNISKTKMLTATTKYNNGDFDDSSNLIFNGNSTIENLKHSNTLFDQKVGFTNKFKNKKVLLLTGRFIHEKSPQNYSFNQFFYQDLFPSFSTTNNITQKSTNQMQFAGFNAHLLDRKSNDHLLELQLGNEYREDRLTSEFSLLENETILNMPNEYQNDITYGVNDLYLKSKYRYKLNDFALTGKLHFHQLFSQLKNSTSSKNENPFFINPSIALKWKINDKNKITSSYSYNTTNAKSLDVFNNYTLTGFRSFSKGTGSFNQLNATSVTFNYRLGNWSDRFFANTFISYRKNHNFFSTNALITQDFTQSEKILIKDREFLNVNSNLDYYFKFISSNLKLDIGYSKIEFKNIVNNSNLREITSNNYYYGLEFRSGFKGFFNYHLGVKWTTNNIETTIDNSYTDNLSFLDLSFIFNDKFDFQLQSERYFFGNLETDNTYYFIDFDIRYKFPNKKLSIGMTGKNLLNTEKFSNFSISDIGTSTVEYRLLPRFVLLKMEYKF
ncbi:carboxypeptidase-like regulatory domain-containing protein [uncultured Aquimarina sp.]|uniref:carboxypeptidase-like regulatory domain-containing protein n=1 Tax=uncultured Aquimarina sp. TaxID=575652 RepID=UPI00260A00C7|nr:carboxypeptidase-like regulatory domain-containing protein [uncultured Aquimarina sp.]